MRDSEVEQGNFNLDCMWEGRRLWRKRERIYPGEARNTLACLQDPDSQAVGSGS